MGRGIFEGLNEAKSTKKGVEVALYLHTKAMERGGAGGEREMAMTRKSN